jgi:glucose-6-phosphate dehydrogenase assembly protein OpcA
MSAEMSVLIEEPRGVDISLIERELTRLWKDASEDQEARGASPVIRACSMNLVVVTNDESRASAIGELVGDVSVSHPSRIFLVVLESRGGESHLDAWVSARCSLPTPGQNQVCCEEITLTASGSERKKVSGIVTPLLVPDLPTVVIWKSDAGLEESGIGAFLPFADRVIIDSSELHRPGEVLLSWARFMEAGDDPSSRMNVARAGSFQEALFGDLSWTHLTPWRSLLARVFQPVEVRKVLAEISDVLIEFSSRPSPAHSGLAQAYLLSGWLADRLGWDDGEPFRELSSGELRARLQARSRSGPVTVRAFSVPPTDPFAGSLESVTIRGSGDTVVQLQLTEKKDCVRLEREVNGFSVEEFLRYPVRQDEAVLLAQELDILHREPAYERTMSRLSRLLAEQDQ